MRDSTDKPMPGVREFATITDATPARWHVRVIFSELLDPDVEELVEENGVVVGGTLAQSQPFILRCGGAEVPYDGWLDPGGSHLSFPPGPSVVATWSEYVASGTDDCEIELKPDAITDKDGEPVPESQLGPYEFGIAPMAVLETAPLDADEGVDPTSAISLVFNAPIDMATVADQIVVTTGDTEVPVEVSFPTDEEGNVTDDTSLNVVATDGLAPETEYTVTVATGIADPAGGALAEGLTLSFTTGEASEDE
jgi:Bacterial Ig-like domain